MRLTKIGNNRNPLDEAIATGCLASNPYPIYARIRRQAPVLWSERWNCWVLSRHGDVVAALKDVDHFSSVGRTVRALKANLSETERARVQPLIDHYSKGLIHSDPPDHRRMRRIVQGSFTPRTLEKLRPEVYKIVNELLDKAEPRGRLEAVNELTFQLPVRVIAELLGVSADMREQIKTWSVGVTEFMATPNPGIEVAERSQKALLELRDFFAGEFEQRRQHPGDDLISLLINAADEGDCLTEEELQSTCVTILIGGHETTTSLSASAILELARRPALRDTLRDQPDRMPLAVEEFLRLEPPFQRILRVVKKPTKAFGENFEAGQLVTLLLGSANRDETVFNNPDELDLDRGNRKHLAFGHGIHFCLGAGLARLEVPILLECLLKRFPNFTLNEGEPAWHDGMIRCLQKLPIRLEP